MDRDAGAGKDCLSSEGPARQLHASEKLADMEKDTVQKGERKTRLEKSFQQIQRRLISLCKLMIKKTQRHPRR